LDQGLTAQEKMALSCVFVVKID